MKYVVSSDRVVGHARGDTIAALPGANMQALEAAGHVRPAPAPAKKSTKKATRKD